MPRSFLVKKHHPLKNRNCDALAVKTHDPQPSLPHGKPPASITPSSPMSLTYWETTSLVAPTQLLQYPSAPLENPITEHPHPAPFRHDVALLGERVPSCSRPVLGLVTGRGHERFECFDCRKAYFTFSGLAKHRQLQCECQYHRFFSCKFCNKEYVSLGALKMHIRTHTLPCVCKICGKAFSRPWLLQGHIRTHTGEKPFTCPHCSRAFADRSNLRAHLQTHSEFKKYQCRGCAKTFSRISLLSKHQEAGC